jgi:hypothetical protein
MLGQPCHAWALQDEVVLFELRAVLSHDAHWKSGNEQ